MAAEDLYANEADPADAGGTPGPSEPPAGEEPAAEPEKQEDATEAVLPKSILAGKEFKVGDEVVLKITAMHDDQISVAYAPSKEGDETEKSGASPEMVTGGDSDYD